mgnify:CR=1 FL=1
MAKAPVEAMARVPKSSFYSCSTISKQTLCEKYHISTRYTCILIFFEISENNPKLNTEHSTEAQTSLLEYQRHAFKLLQRYLDTAVLFDELESMSTLEENGNEKEESLQGEEEKEDGVLREEDLLAGFKLFRSSSIESAREHRKKREKEAKAKKKRKRKEESDSDEEDKRLEMLRAAVIDVPQTKWLSNGPEVVDKKKERQMNVDLLVGKVISSKAVEPNAAVKKSTSLPSLLVPTPTPTAKTSTENGKENEDTKKKKKKKSKRKEDKASETKETKKKGTKRKKSEETSTTEAAADGDREKKKRKLGGDHNPLALLTKKAKKRVKTKPKAA